MSTSGATFGKRLRGYFIAGLLVVIFTAIGYLYPRIRKIEAELPDYALTR